MAQSELSQATPKFLPQKFRLGKIGTIRNPKFFTFFDDLIYIDLALEFLTPPSGKRLHNWLVVSNIFSMSYMGCHPNPIDELHHFSRWLFHMLLPSGKLTVGL